MPVGPTQDTLLTISSFGTLLYSARGLTQTWATIKEASSQEYDNNGVLVDLSNPAFQQYETTITCTDISAPPLDNVFQGMVVTVGWVCELSYATGNPGSPGRAAVPGSTNVVGAFTYYRPLILMMVTEPPTMHMDEYACVVGWEIKLKEVRSPSGMEVELAPKTYIFTVDPGALNDATQGYSVGSTGINTATGDVFVCRTAAAGVAVWVALAPRYFPGYVAGNWIQLAAPGSLTGNDSAHQGWIKFAPFYLRERCTIDKLGINVLTADPGGNVQLALYTADVAGGTMKPLSLIGSTGSISVASAGAVLGTLTSPAQLEQGLYWYATCADNATVVYEAINAGLDNSIMPMGIGDPSLSNLFDGDNPNNGYIYSGVFGTWPAGPLVLSNLTAWGSGSDIATVAAHILSIP